MTTALDIIKGAARRCQAYQSGETIAPQDAQDMLDTLNDLLDSLSTDRSSIYGSNENILYFTPGKTQYTIGNPLCTDLGLTAFQGVVTSGSNIITGISSIPSGVTAGTSASGTAAGSSITSLQNLFPTGTYVTAIGTNTVTVSQNATGTSVGNDSLTYSIPGNFAIPRPLRCTSAFTRYSALDFTLEVTMSQERFNEILYKSQPGPWPTVAWYNTQFPYALLNVYPSPSQAGELHLFTDTILGRLTMTQAIIMPQGYVRMLKWLLAEEFCGEFGYALTESIKHNAEMSRMTIKALNAEPAVQANYERDLMSTSGRPDGGWILTGGYR